MWVLVTGAARGIGRAITLALAKEGYNLVLHYRKSSQKAEEVARLCRELGVQAETLQGDFATQEGLNHFIVEYKTRYQKSYALIYNVGNYLISPLHATTQNDWYSLFQTNFFAPLFLMNSLSDALKESRGSVVLIGNAGTKSSKAYLKAIAYSSSKSALYQTMLSYAKEWSQDKVTVNMVSPGFVQTSVDLEEVDLPMGRAATVEEVARVVSFLLARESEYITGQNIEVAGGFSL